MANLTSSPDYADLEKAWDDVCLNPHKHELEEGRQQGREAGLEAGYREGYELGRTNGIEYGMEIGFIRGVVCALKERSFENNERISKTIDDLSKALDGFPGPEEVFRENTLQTRTHQTLNDDSEQPEEPSEELDVRGRLQRIRARFKLLTVQLGMPHFSLKQVMDQAAARTLGAAETQREESSEW